MHFMPGALKLVISDNCGIMDGDRNRAGPFSCEVVKKKEVW